MGEPYVLKDMEATGDIARSIMQYDEKFVTNLAGAILASLNPKVKKKLTYTYEEWQRNSTAFMFDEDIINDFNNLVNEANFHDVDLNEDKFFKKKFLKYLRPQFEKKKRGFAQVVQLSGMGNLEPPKKKAETQVKRLQIKGAYRD